ncbi:TonB-dependent receptor family protein [Flavihumibacter stibioxidans]|uniref:TonB-dependent receptor family protein n=1 Tax=Flavihumibacter stibioxidans TaxID=1834163 RepID=UPI00164F0111|nr:TonB-dependent receptor [Flavihumibacter stibioxidans]
MRKITLLSFLVFGWSIAAVAQKGEDTGAFRQDMPQVLVVGYKDKLLSKVPGSVSVLRFKDIRQMAPVSGNDVMKRVPGLNVVDEEGAGLRINIGVRGLDPDRSRNLLMLEDGVPVALNPYGEPEMYFTPVIDKVRNIEVLKGSGQVMFGPQTIGGVVNLITADPPEKEKTELRIKGGQGGFFSGYASYGNTVGNVGFIVSVLRKQADNIGPTWFRINDVSAKVRVKLSEKGSVGMKLGFYDEISNSTYVGLTQTMWDQGGTDYARIAPHDRLPVRRYNFSVTHQYKFTERASLQTTAFAYTTTRNWQRQNFSSNPAATNQTGEVWGDPSVPGGALFMQNSNGHRNRQFEVAGVEPRLVVKGMIAGKENKLQTGVRFLYEKANEQFIVGKKADATAGDLRDNEVRSGNALSAYLQDELNLTERLTINAGVRMEHFDYARRILRGRFSVNGTTVVADTNVVAKDKVFGIIPGAGFSYLLHDDITIFGGVHKGFAPPRTKDAITSTGMAIQLDEESSWNYELGMRYNNNEWVSGELTFFAMSFGNQIIPVSQSSGNSNATGLANGGRTLHKGLEGALQLDLGKAFGWEHSLTVGNNFTFVDSRYVEDRFIESGSDKVNVRDNKLPYAPSFIWNGSIGFEAKKGWGLRMLGNYVTEQYSDELNTELPTANGRIGKIDARFLFDASVWYQFPSRNITLSVCAKNLGDNRYIASRRPEGIKVGLPAFVTAGIDIVF